ncbi:thioredoxin-disulfide reductase [Acidimicrobiales bacterium]|nr:thioredoxin-disulfide reductase [Acidimicrobiaceae bacterium]MBT6444659.1 thioredoxin-disulfide reductase [Acidimicrobiaceae bacterium]MDC1389920.1 thioredoxin-disulfide reductase [Acidimicrobiales bacterium]MDG1087918.1 thioredoxin-disulfide reductase [Acidimicrobiales bacterium]HAY68718.1 thioredoxin-disulfide reductase [Acidimicrobiaceae bacterium]
MTAEHHEVIIIGSGPAGLTAAIYAARARLAPLVIEGEPSSTSDQPGGQLMLTTDVENFPGFPEGIMGPELMGMFRTQAERFGATMVTRKVVKVDLSASPGDTPHKLWIDDATTPEPTYTATAVIIATGAQSLMLGLPNESALVGHGLSTCATCDGFFFRDQEIAVVGGGDSALEEAMFLTRFASKVSLLVRRDELRASKIMQDRALANEKIEIVWNTVVTGYLGDGMISGIATENTQTGEAGTLDVTGIFIAIGHKPSTSLFVDQLEVKPNGYLVAEPNSTRTAIPGVFACGDVVDDYYRQAITAAGSGCQAAIDTERWLEGLDD